MTRNNEAKEARGMDSNGVDRRSFISKTLLAGGGLERDGQLLVIKEARAEEAQKEVENWLRKIKMLP